MSNKTHLSPRILIYDAEETERVNLSECLCRGRNTPAIQHAAERRTIASLTDDDVEVAFINVLGKLSDGLAVGAELGSRFPWIEIVYWFSGGSGCPVAAVAQSIGISRLVPQAGLAEWAAAAISSLTKMARIRRQLLAEARSLPPIPEIDDSDSVIRLPEAERRFREAYLRRLLAESDSHVVAARKAGIPYTTLCSMIKKFDIH
jgi:hypothetical protein